ncbi:MAG: dihydrolipoyl dehydrogenase, partial [Pseudomonadota bacterium]|nr:dihydrolipoyl dehydrogenase [Pseudomonadota bacterium]
MRTDVVIIGAGTAGLAAAREVSKQTEDFLLVDPGPLGTTCARVGCMPSKLLIEAARAYHSRLSFAEFGIQHADKLAVDMPAVMQRVQKLRDFFVDSTLEATERFSLQLLRQKARLLGPNRVEAGGEIIDCKKIIIATGSRPVVPDSWQAYHEHILTSDNLFDQNGFARRIAVIGLGAIGLEIAQALSRLGVEITGFGSDKMLAGLSDKQVNNALHESLNKEFKLKLGEDAELEQSPNGVKVKAGDFSDEFEQVIVAIGRKPNIDNIGLENLDIELDEQGLPHVDPHTLQLEDQPVFIAGDVRADTMLLHEAADDGRIAGHNAVAESVSSYCRRIPLSVVFCEPEVAVVGQPAAELEKQDYLSGKVDFSKQGRARAAQNNSGYLKVYADRQTGRLLGAEMAAPDAGHLA